MLLYMSIEHTYTSTRISNKYTKIVSCKLGGRLNCKIYGTLSNRVLQNKYVKTLREIIRTHIDPAYLWMNLFWYIDIIGRIGVTLKKKLTYSISP